MQCNVLKINITDKYYATAERPNMSPSEANNPDLAIFNTERIQNFHMKKLCE